MRKYICYGDNIPHKEHRSVYRKQNQFCSCTAPKSPSLTGGLRAQTHSHTHIMDSNLEL